MNGPPLLGKSLRWDPRSGGYVELGASRGHDGEDDESWSCLSQLYGPDTWKL